MEFEQNRWENIEAQAGGFFYLLKKYFFRPLKSAISGFVLFFMLILLIKILKYFFINEYEFNIEIFDFIIASAGFILSYLFSILELTRYKSF